MAYDVGWQGKIMRTGIISELVPHLDNACMMDPETFNKHERDQFRALMMPSKRQRLHGSANELIVR